ncbi:Uncharacterised protein [Atlantibacter hermannii]|nr:Uncharacterised protein [Atlantibacter hermannii]
MARTGDVQQINTRGETPFRLTGRAQALPFVMHLKVFHFILTQYRFGIVITQ